MVVSDNYTRVGTVPYIVDGDTFDIDADLGFFVNIRIRIRIKGIDAPELHGLNRKSALVSKQYLIDNILNKKVFIISTAQDSFRRWVADVYFNDSLGVQHNLADDLFSTGLATLNNFVK